MGEHAVVVRDLSKRYKNGVLANDQLSLSVRSGSVFALLGPNGAGKTTFVRQLTGELEPTSGEVRILGIDAVRDPLGAKGRMGVVPQEANPYPFLKPAEQLSYFGQLHGMPRKQADARARTVLTMLDLNEHTDKVTMNLSGGLKRKLLVGCAMMPDPGVLILDEPTTGLDPHSRRQVWNLIRHVRSLGSTILITTHYMDEAEVLADRVAVIGNGKILAEGTVEDLRGLCRNRFKATYDDDAGERHTVYGMSQREVADEMEGLGVAEYSLMRTNLEDLYLELTGSRMEEGEEEAVYA